MGGIRLRVVGMLAVQRGVHRALTATLFGLLAVLIAAPATAASPGTHAAQSRETGRVVVGFTGAVSTTQIQRIAKESGARVVRTIQSGDVAIVDPRAGFSADRVVARLEEAAGVRYAQPERRVHALFTPDDPSFALQWGMTRIGAPLAWDVQRGSSSVTVAVIDSGVDYTHPDLVGRLDTANGYDFIENDTQAQDAYGHGTHVAGIVSADINNSVAVAGLAGGCKVMPIRVLDSSGNGTDVGVAQAIRWAADHGAEVINLSLGTPEASTIMQEACDYAIAADCVVVAASGNSAAQSAWVPGQIQHPAAYEPVVAVGAIDSAGARASFSEWGSALDLVGPGVGIVSLYPVDRGSQVTISGTSMATAHVSGVAALVRSQNTGWSAAETIARLGESAEDLGAAGRDDQFGRGLVRADSALGVAGPPQVVPPSDGDSSTVPDDDVDDHVDDHVDDDTTISNTDDGNGGGSGSGRLSTAGGSGRGGDSGSDGDSVSDTTTRSVRGAGTGGASESGGTQAPALPQGTAEKPGESTPSWRDPFTIALIAVAAFVGVGLWRLWRRRARRSANS